MTMFDKEQHDKSQDKLNEFYLCAGTSPTLNFSDNIIYFTANLQHFTM